MKLYTMPGACSLASHIALVWADALYELRLLDHDSVRGPEYARINPKLAVPALELDEGVVITESLAVLLYIANRFPSANLGARAADIMGRARLNEALSELVSELHKAYAPIFVPDRYVTNDADQDSAKNAAYGQLDLKFAHFEQLLSDGRAWLVLGHRTVADAYLYVMCSWKDDTPTPLAHFPHLAAHSARIGADAGVKRALSEQVVVPTPVPDSAYEHSER